MSIDTVRLITYSYELFQDSDISLKVGGGSICIESQKNQTPNMIQQIIEHEIKSHFTDLDFNNIRIRFTIKEDKNRKLYKIDNNKTCNAYVGLLYTSIIASITLTGGILIGKYIINGNDSV